MKLISSEEAAQSHDDNSKNGVEDKLTNQREKQNQLTFAKVEDKFVNGSSKTLFRARRLNCIIERLHVDCLGVRMEITMRDVIMMLITKITVMLFHQRKIKRFGWNF
jgi:hypothetical protein